MSGTPLSDPDLVEREYRVFGPPGCGKTTFLAASVTKQARERQSSRIMVASFTRTAAAEVAGRNLPIDASQIGTLHSLAFRAIGHPDVAQEQLGDWNRMNPALAQTTTFRPGVEESAPADMTGATEGDVLMSDLDTCRAKMLPPALWPARVRAFEAKWTAWKDQLGVVDFCMDEQTEVLTRRGWLDGWCIREGDEVRALRSDGLACWQPVEGVYRRVGRAKMIAHEGESHSSLTTPEHRWLAEDTTGALRWRTSEQLCGTDRIVCAAQPADLPTESKYDDDLVELVAWWFTEGSRNGSGGQIGQSHAVNPHHVERLRALLTRMFGPAGVGDRGRGDKPPRWNVARYRPDLTTFLLSRSAVEALDSAAPDKVPSAAFLNSLTRSQLLLFVDTAVNADGWRRSDGARFFAQSDPRRVDAIVTAASLLGVATRTTWRAGAGPYVGRQQAVVTLLRGNRVLPPHATAQARRLGRRGVARREVDYEGLIWCPTVAEHHTFLARRRGTVYYTGNTDMIEYALNQTTEAPGSPLVGYFDEVQDFTPLELSLVRHWGRAMDRIVLAGDDDQCIYTFKGATPEAFLDPAIPDERKHVLSQSYRVPRAVHSMIERWIRQVAHREPKAYLPRDEDGRVRRLDLRYTDPDPVVRDVLRRVDSGRTVMLLTTCSYMLDPIKRALKEAGVPFHNPYRASRIDWNPMRAARGSSGTDKLLAYLILDERTFGEHSREWTGQDVKRWSSVVKKQGVFRRGAAGALAGLPDRSLTYEEVAALFESEDQLAQAVEPSVEWLRSNLLASARPTMEYPIAVARRRGARALVEEPRVVIGTVHCSPADEPVLTTTGWVQMGDLDVDRHRLVSYLAGSNNLTGSSDHPNTLGYQFRRSVRPYSGPLVCFDSEMTHTRVTPNHVVRARLSEGFEDRWVVYLMRRGSWWRVGVCTSAHRPYRSGGVGGRLATEQADSGWLLGVYDSRHEALIAEATVQLRYGVPGLTFQSARARSLSQTDLAMVHDAASAEVGVRAKQLLADFGLLEDAPLYTRSTPGGVVRKRNLRGWFDTAAGNLVALSGRVEVPARSESSTRPVPSSVSVSVQDYSGEVYGLDVEPHHYYVSGGAVVHNSVKGGQADDVLLFPDLSIAGMREWTDARRRDSVVRQMYVGASRARRELVVCSNSSQWAVDPDQLARGRRG